MIFFGESSLRRAIHEYIAHCRVERGPQGFGNEQIEKTEPTTTGDVACTTRLGGIREHYRRAA